MENQWSTLMKMTTGTVIISRWLVFREPDNPNLRINDIVIDLAFSVIQFLAHQCVQLVSNWCTKVQHQHTYSLRWDQDTTVGLCIIRCVTTRVIIIFCARFKSLSSFNSFMHSSIEVFIRACQHVPQLKVYSVWHQDLVPRNYPSL